MFQFPSIEFGSYCLDARSQHQLYLLLVTFRPSKHILYHSILRCVTTASCHLLLYLELGYAYLGVRVISAFATGRFTPAVVVTARVCDQDGSDDLVSSLLRSLRKQLIK